MWAHWGMSGGAGVVAVASRQALTPPRAAGSTSVASAERATRPAARSTVGASACTAQGGQQQKRPERTDIWERQRLSRVRSSSRKCHARWSQQRRQVIGRPRARIAEASAGVPRAFFRSVVGISAVHPPRAPQRRDQQRFQGTSSQFIARGRACQFGSRAQWRQVRGWLRWGEASTSGWAAAVLIEPHGVARGASFGLFH